MSYVESTIDHVIVLEGEVEAHAEAVATLAGRHPRVAALVDGLRTTTRRQRAALESQLERATRAGDDRLRLALSVSALYGTLSEAALAYAVLHAVAHRAFDSQAEGNTADLAEAHLRSYAALIQQLDLVISDVVTAELSSAGTECSCQCPACGLGLCVCSPHGANTVRQAWHETEAPAPDAGLRVRQPRSGSEAQRVGLRADDQVVAIDATTITTDLDTAAVQGAIREHAPGDEMVLKVRRGPEERFEAIVRRP